jgi:hypothetical protein
MHVQFSNQNMLACPITNSHLISKVLNGLTSILTNKLLKYENSVRRCAANGPVCVLVILIGCLMGPELSMPFQHPCTALAFYPEHFSDHCHGLHHTFSKICTKFDVHSLSDASGKIQNSK